MTRILIKLEKRSGETCPYRVKTGEKMYRMYKVTNQISVKRLF